MLYFDLNWENKCKITTMHLYEISPEITDNFCLEHMGYQEECKNPQK